MALRLEDLRPSDGAYKKSKRVGRGPGSGLGKTSGKGHKGQKARSGNGKIVPGFEGGQTPIYMRVPKRGFKNFMKKNFTVVNLTVLEERFSKDEDVTVEALLNKGIIKKTLDGVKLLGNGEISKALNVKLNAYSKSAKEKIEAAGGKVELLESSSER